MMYVSTRNKNNRVTAPQAVLQGLAQDGGLFVPEEIPQISFTKDELLGIGYNDLVIRVLDTFLPGFGEAVLRDVVEQGYKDKFDSAFPAMVVHAGDASYLELYHGPTSAFKDMALCLLPRLVTAAGKLTGKETETVILTATSGDTGKAALAGFADVPGTRIIVFYPADGVSAVQKAQMVTQEGDNTCVCAVRGNFDDAQRGVKKAFLEVKGEGYTLSSANSINIGRLVPQIAYYYWAYARMVADGKLAWGEKLNFSVPTGNFGDILAGWYAKQSGLPVGTLICASNKNRILTDFISTGVYGADRPFYLTASPSMDILVSSNLERLLFAACGGDDQRVRGMMKDLAEKKQFAVNADELAFIRKDFACGCGDDKATLAFAADVWKKDKYLMDPHTAVAAYCAVESPCVILSTASPYKFAPAMVDALGARVPEDGFEAMENLEAMTGVPAPAGLRDLKQKAVRHKDICEIDEIVSYVSKKVAEKH